MIDLLLDLVPLAVFIAALAVAFLAIRLQRHLGNGPYSAGPLEVQKPDPPGQEATPWELKAIDDQLTLLERPSGVVRRYDLTNTINRLSTAAGLHGPGHELPITATSADLYAAVSRIEQRLDLPPLEEYRHR
ncbi:MAG: hypothetical protein AAF962_06480 [Actinomycetota bacterium]